MGTFVLIHGAEECGWAWHRVVEELARRGHTAVAPDLPIDDERAGLAEYVETVGDALRSLERERDEPLVVVGHSLGAFTAPLVADEQQADHLILLAPLIPRPGESVNEWWTSSGYVRAASEQREADGGLTNHADPYVSFYNDVPRELADESMRRTRAQASGAMHQPWPRRAWPDVPTRVVFFRDDRFLPPAFVVRLAAERIRVTVEELPGGHCAPLSHPVDLVDALVRDVRGVHP